MTDRGVVQSATITPTFSTPRVIIGCWQLSEGHASTRLDKEQLFSAFDFALDLGYVAFDCADIYTNVESILGEFIARHRHRGGAAAAERIQVHTKFVPDLDDLGTLRRSDVDRIVHRSLHRLGVEQLDLVQFAWWDYEVPRYVEVASWLVAKQREGVIANLGATNFDTLRLNELLTEQIPLRTHQVQFSVLDQRAAGSMIECCERHGISLLCYGTLAGGLISQRYVHEPPPLEPFENRSLRKYMLIVEEFGGWVIFQRLLETLHEIAQRRGTGLAEVAMRFVLDQPMVAGIVLGVRSVSHLQRLHNVWSVALSAADRKSIRDTLREARGPGGEVFELERDRNGPHGRIMRYNLNARSPGE